MNLEDMTGRVWCCKHTHLETKLRRGTHRAHRAIRFAHDRQDAVASRSERAAVVCDSTVTVEEGAYPEGLEDLGNGECLEGAAAAA